MFHIRSYGVWLAVVGLLLFIPCVAAVAGPTVWFCPMDPVVRHDIGDGGSPGYMGLFDPQADWAVAASRVKVFAIYSEWLSKASDEDLQRQFADLRRRGIALAWEPGPLTRSTDCAVGVQGESSGGQNLAARAERIKRDGGDLKYIDMDEPLFFSALAKQKYGRQNCNWSPEEVAADAAKNLLPVKAIFPNVQFGDTEPIGPVPAEVALPRYQRGIEAFQKALGEPLAFFQLDCLWHATDIPAQLTQAKAMLQSEHIPIGVIYWGSALATSDTDWLRLEDEHMRLVESTIGVPDIVIFQSWNRYPKKLLPDSDPGAFTSMIRNYHQ